MGQAPPRGEEGRKEKKSKEKKDFVESGTRTPTLPFTGTLARIVPVEPPWLDNKLKGPYCHSYRTG